MGPMANSGQSRLVVGHPQGGGTMPWQNFVSFLTLVGIFEWLPVADAPIHKEYLYPSAF